MARECTSDDSDPHSHPKDRVDRGSIWDAIDPAYFAKYINFSSDIRPSDIQYHCVQGFNEDFLFFSESSDETLNIDPALLWEYIRYSR